MYALQGADLQSRISGQLLPLSESISRYVGRDRCDEDLLQQQAFSSIGSHSR